MKLLLSLATAVSLALPACGEAELEPSLRDNDQPAPRQLLDDVIARLPSEPLIINGDLTLRKRRGVVVRELKFRMELSWGASPPTARYVIMDAFGAKLDEMTVLRTGGGLEFKRPADAAPPNPTEAIQQTDVSWADLALSFLWWKAESITGKEEVRGRNCYIVEVVPPSAEEKRSGAAAEQYAKVLLWVDEKLRVLLRAEGFDSRGKLERSLWVTSFKKINDRWMIKEMEIQSSLDHRTKLVVRDVDGASVGETKEPEP